MTDIEAGAIMSIPTQPHLSRRNVVAALLAATVSSLIPLPPLSAQGLGSSPIPFRVNVPQTTIDHIVNRVREAQFPDRLDAPDLRYGVSWDYMRALRQYWIEQFDWRKAEANLNRYPQFLARIGDYDIHFYHVKGRGPRPMPLILSHGWPGSAFEFLEAIGPLSDPGSFGGSPEDAFDVVVPSLPGYGFSSKPTGKPIGRGTVTALWQKLMKEVLGYPKYGAQGGDLSGALIVLLALQFPDSLTGIHLNGVPAGGPLPPEAEQTPEEQDWVKAANAFIATERGYFIEHQTKPQTIAFALHDNPIGTAAWIVEKVKGWSDSDSITEPALTKDQVLTNVMIYLVTNTIGTSMWMYRGNVDDVPNIRGKVTVPTGKVSLPKELPGLDPPRSILARNYNLVHYTKMPRGGHFAFWEQPEAMVADVRQFFRKLRS
jgi:pimeloyl-ACP methyl ester carboxylesterase